MPCELQGPFVTWNFTLSRDCLLCFLAAASKKRALLFSSLLPASDALENGRERIAQQDQLVTASAMDQSIYRSHVRVPRLLLAAFPSLVMLRTLSACTAPHLC
jgi:hypothetical protein